MDMCLIKCTTAMASGHAWFPRHAISVAKPTNCISFLGDTCHGLMGQHMMAGEGCIREHIFDCRRARLVTARVSRHESCRCTVCGFLPTSDPVCQAEARR